MAKNFITENFSEPLNRTTTARINIHAGDGNLIIDPVTGDGQALANGTLQYFEKQGQPRRSVVSSNGQATFSLRGGKAGQPWFRLPWAACNGASEWQIHLNPEVASEISACSDGGNIRLDLAGTIASRVSAETGGGNIVLILPQHTADLRIAARSGAGNVIVCLPSHYAARIHATTGLGKVIMDPKFSKTAKDTYQSPDFEGAAWKAEITISSGAGNVSVEPI